SGASCSSSAAGDHTVTGTDGAASGTASLHVTPAALHHLVLSPASAAITAGGSQGYTAEGFDQFNNSRGDVTGATAFDVDGHPCSAATCSPTTAGDHTVTGTDGTATGTATLHVTPAALDHLALSPADATITAGGSQGYTAEGFDQFNNSRGDVTGATVLSIGP